MMKFFKKITLSAFMIAATLWLGCKLEPVDDGDLTMITHAPTPYSLELPAHFPPMNIPADNPMTRQGIELGRHLFYDPILSRDSSMSCSTCHMPAMGFADGERFSTGIDGIKGTRSAMSLLNIGFVNSGLFWDGRVKTLEDQALLPVEDPIEMHHQWTEIMPLLQKSTRYTKMFREAFDIKNTSQITKELAAKAIAQFERTIISKDSKYDRVKEGKAKYTDLELYGFSLFFDEDPDVPDAECWHCHNVPFGSSDDFFNNGLTATSDLNAFPDPGRGKVTKSILDNGKFRAPTLRNISMTAPYMHDGQFSTLDEVFDHYNRGGKKSDNSDGLIKELFLDDFSKKALFAFIETLRDTVVIKKPELQNPFK
jgi:cytochrome c peroxidase